MSGTEGADNVKIERPAGHCCLSAVLDQEAQLDPTDSKWEKLGLPHGQEGMERGYRMKEASTEITLLQRLQNS